MKIETIVQVGQVIPDWRGAYDERNQETAEECFHVQLEPLELSKEQYKQLLELTRDHAIKISFERVE